MVDPELEIAGAPPPPNRNEVLLREAVDRLRSELDVARTFRDDVAAALRPGRWRGFDGPDVSKDEVIADVASALDTYDKAMGGK